MRYVSILPIALAFSLGCGSKAPETDVKEPEVAAEPVDFALRMVSAIATELIALAEVPAVQRRAHRSQRYRRLGLPG